MLLINSGIVPIFQVVEGFHQKQMTVYLGVVMKYGIRNYVKYIWHDTKEKDVYLYISAYCMQ